MTVPVLTQAEFMDHLKKNGCTLVSDKYWNDFDRIIFEKDGEIFPVQMKDKYFFPLVCKTCETLGIIAPKDHQKCYDQLQKLKNKGQ